MPPRPQMQIRVRGTVYKDAHEAAAALGVSLSRVYEAASRDALDNLGIGRGRHKNHIFPRSRPVRFGPLHFGSIRQAAETLRIPRKIVGRAARDPGAYARVLAAAMEYARVGGKTPCGRKSGVLTSRGKRGTDQPRG